MLVGKILPFLVALVAVLVRIAAAIGISGSPFRNEYGEASVDCLFGAGAFADPFVAAAFPLVGVRVVVECICSILFAVCHLVTECLMGVLVPFGVTHENQVVRILADDLDDLVCVILHIAPGNLLGLIE